MIRKYYTGVPKFFTSVVCGKIVFLLVLLQKMDSLLAPSIGMLHFDCVLRPIYHLPRHQHGR
jgi:hypothetical protein